MIIVNARTMNVVDANTKIIVHACTMFVVRACTMLMVHACTIILVHASYPIGAMFGETQGGSVCVAKPSGKQGIWAVADPQIPNPI